MKNIWIFLASMLVFLYSCTDEPLINNTQSLRITGYLDTDSRTVLIQEGNITHTHWVEEDMIGIYTDKQTNLPYKALSGGTTTEFVGVTETLERTEGNKAIAYYPYASGNKNMISLPYTTSFNSTEPVPVFLYSDATINGQQVNFKFKHYFAYLRITVTAEMFRSFKNNHNHSDKLTYEGSGIHIKSSEPISCFMAKLNMETMEMTNGSDCMRIIYQCPDIDVESDGSYTFMIPMLPQSPSAKIDISLFYLREKSDGYIYTATIETKNPPSQGIQAGHVYEVNYASLMDESQEQREILKKFYQATGGDQWYNKSKWLSEHPINKWYGVNKGNDNYLYVNSLDLPNNNLTGQLPIELAALMDKAERINLEGNRLSGEIPDEIKNHEKWPSLGWGIIHQNYDNGGGFNLANSGLYATESNVTHLTDQKQSTLNDIFARNKLTQVITLEPEADQVLDNFDALRVNKHLDYQSKGLETIIFTGAEEGKDYNEFSKAIHTLYGKATGVSWLYGNHQGEKGYSYIFDTQGQLVYIAPYKKALYDNREVQKNLDEFLRTTLGDPAEHQDFKINYYTSTDYSMDGEVYLLQQATKGKGIDIVLMGEGFTDQHMNPGGRYETKMQEATEKIFSIEPYKSLRNRFNVYVVKAVSPNAEFFRDAVNAINENQRVALSYAALTGTECPLVAVIYNTEKELESSYGPSYCTMYLDNSCVAFDKRKIGGTLIHELCGHGIANLADEYVDYGNENLYLPEQKRKNLEENYLPSKWGWFRNVDYHASASTVRWAHILSDNRFAAEELGIYEGAWLYGHGVYRSSENSIMRSSNLLYFNAPSREIIYKAVMTRSEGDEWLSTYNYEDFVTFDEAARKEYANSRSISVRISDKELREMNDRHLPPTIIKGSWRDELKKSTIRIPLR